MKRKVLLLVVMAVFGLLLNACWPAEVGVDTTFTNARGAGTREIIIDIMDDTLSEEPIPNPEDPEGTKGKGPVVNDWHIDGGLNAIQTYLEENAPSWMTIEEVEVDGVHRFFKMTYAFNSFDDFLSKYEELVNMSPTMSWEDFAEDELPTWTTTTEGNTKTATYTESLVILQASLDWAVDGIWNNLYNEQNLAGYVDKASIWEIANYTLTVSDENYEELRHYDEEREDGEFLGKIVFVESADFELSGDFETATLGGCFSIGSNVTSLGNILLSIGLAFGFMVILFKKPV
jgi:hypothetical protein